MLRCPHAGDRGVVFALLSAELAVSTLDRTHMRRNSQDYQGSESSPLQRIHDHQHLAVCHGPITISKCSKSDRGAFSGRNRAAPGVHLAHSWWQQQG